MFVTITNINDIDLQEKFLCITNNFNVIILFEKGEIVNTRNSYNNILLTKDKQLKNILMITEQPTIYITSPNVGLFL